MSLSWFLWPKAELFKREKKKKKAAEDNISGVPKRTFAIKLFDPTTQTWRIYRVRFCRTEHGVAGQLVF
jgi:hypothetical protein